MIPYGKSRSKVIYEGNLYSRQNKDLDMSPYRYLLITYVLFPYADDHNSGMNNILLMDLTKKVDDKNVYTAANLAPYNIFSSDYNGMANESMGIGCTVNNDKNNLKVVMSYGKNILASTETRYYVSKVVGVY